MSLISALAAALELGDRPALCFGARAIARAELAAEAERLKRALLEQGVLPGDRVALLCPNHPAFVAAQLAVLAAGALLVPLNPLYQPGELSPLINDSRPRVLLCLDLVEGVAQAALLAIPEPVRPRCVVLEDPALEPGLERLLRAQLPRVVAPASAGEPRYPLSFSTKGRLEPIPVADEAPAVVIFSSGTTGRPRGAVLSQGNLEASGRFIARDWLGGEIDVPDWVPPRAGQCSRSSPHRTLGALPLCHNFGLNVSIDATLLHGGTLVILPRFSAVEALRAMEEWQVTFTPLVPTMVQALVGNPEAERVELSSWRLLASGGAALPGALREALAGRFPGLAMRDTYGLSEASLAACTRPWGIGKPGTVGRAVDDTELRIVDETGVPCPPGGVGEIQVRGPGVMRDYWQRPLELPPPVVEGWLSTGDMGRIDAEGDLTVVDRKKDLIVRGGYKVYPLEVEEVLYRHPAIAEAAVFGVPDPRMGERVMACVVLAPGARVDPATLLSYCRTALAEFKVPSVIEVRDALPRGATGKVLRRRLREELSRS